MAGKKAVRSATHSVRAEDELWAKAKRRAESQGYTINHVINEILEGYARGLINMPKVVKQYAATSAPPK